MSFLFSLNDEKLFEQLPNIFEKYESYIEQAKPLFKLDGAKLEQLVRDIPQHQAFYGRKAADMKQLVSWLENQKAKLESKFTKNYLGGQRVYGAKEQATFIAGEPEIVEMNELIIEAKLIYQHLEEIKDAFVSMGWATTNIVKLRVAELGEVVI